MSLFFRKNCIGIDVGTNTLKLVQLSLKNGRYVVENYVIAENKNFFEENNVKSLNLKLLDNDVALFIKEALKRGKVEGSKRAIISIPAYLSFITVIEMPLMPLGEVAKAIEFEARQYIPIPIKEVMLDWQAIGTFAVKKQPVAAANGSSANEKQPQEAPAAKTEEKMEILLVAVPRYLVEKYQSLIMKSGLVLENIELENFSLIRSIIGNDKSTVAIVDFGAQSTDVNLISEGVLREARTLDANGAQMTRSLSKSLNISSERAEMLQRERGLARLGGEEEFTKILLPIVDIVLEEIKRMQRNFLLKKNKAIERVILTGGVSNMPGLVDYFNSKLEIEVGVGNPFKRMVYPPELSHSILEIAPISSIATGLAMRGLM